MKTTCLTSLLLVMVVVLGGCQLVGDAGVMNNVPGNPHAMIFLDSTDGCPTDVRDINKQGTGRPAPQCEMTVTRGTQVVLLSDGICRHPGNTITWRINGGGNQKFSIDFKSGSVPTGWTCSSGDNIVNSCKIASNEPKGNTYEYSVTVDGCVLDPEIIIY